MIEVGIASQPCFGETVSGDAAGAIHDNRGSLLWVVDVLGHGFDAAQVCTYAVAAIQIQAHLAPLPLMQSLHRSLHRTRGAAIGLLSVHAYTATWLGIGNISMTLWSRELYYWSHVGGIERSGIVGFGAFPRLHVQNFRLSGNNWIYVHSDGILPTVQDEPPVEASCQWIADYSLRRFRKMDDDATILVARFTDGPRDTRPEGQRP
jgi:hypothetical protein